MKTFAAATIIAMATVATAQFENIPQCAVACFVDPLTNDGCSALTDFKCHCEKSDSLFASVTPCVQGACTAAEVSTVISEVEKICADAGVTVKVPTPGGSSTPAPSAQSSAAPSSAAASTPAETPAQSSAAQTPSAYPTAGSTTPAAPTGGNATVSSAPTPSEFTGAAALPTAAGVLGAAALALLAL